ncbi:MAG: toll/interleukin-1 receptor domain-containing protein, partial [bacterium]
VEQCSVLLALIASDWLNARKADGSRRLDDPNDYVRQEIALALERGKIVIPVLLGNASMPEARCLPEPLKPLSVRDALTLGVGEKTSVYKAHVDALSRRLATFPNIPPPKKS